MISKRPLDSSGGLIRQWWVQPDHYRWLSGYLGYRNLQGFTRRMMAAVVVSLGAVPMLTLWTPVGPTSLVARTISVLITVCCAVMAYMWLTRWPSRRQSVLFVLASNACIAASCLVTPGQGMALLGCTAFAALAGYVRAGCAGRRADRWSARSRTSPS